MRTPPHLAGGQSAPGLHLELLYDSEVLLGPCWAAIDLLRGMAMIASARGERVRIGWQWTRPDGSAGPRGLPAGGRRRRHPDVLMVPGWHARSGPRLSALVRRHAAAITRLTGAHAGGAQVLAVYTGVALLAEARLLDGRDAVVPWAFATRIEQHAPALRIASGARWIDSDRVCTVDSPADTMPALHAVLRGGPLGPLADSAAAVMLHSPHRQALSGGIGAAAGARVGPGSLERARRWIEANVERPYDLELIASVASISARSLLRHFRTTHGTTPLQYLHRLRATRARMLLETTYLGIDAIAEACGYRDAAMFRRIFERDTGALPSVYRERYRVRTPRREWGRDLG